MRGDEGRGLFVLSYTHLDRQTDGQLSHTSRPTHLCLLFGLRERERVCKDLPPKIRRLTAVFIFARVIIVPGKGWEN